MMQVCLHVSNVFRSFSNLLQADDRSLTPVKPKLTSQQVPLQLVAVVSVARAVVVVAVAVVLDAAATTAAAPQGGSLTGMMALAGGE
jgi:hypothetical protein